MQPYQHTGWFRRDDRGRLRVGGADAASFLQALVTSDVAALPMGGSQDAALLTPQGRMIADLRIFRRPDGFVLSVPAELTSALAERLDASIFSEDVTIADVSASLPHITLVGDSMRDAEDRLGEPPPDGLGELDAGRVEALRIDAGIPKWGVDMTPETIPLEAGLLDRAISQTKGCYPGQEVIVRVLHRGGGRVAKRLMRLRLPGGAAAIPPAGTEIVKDGATIGHITSAAAMNADAVALGYIVRDHALPGSLCDIAGRSASLSDLA
jgi:folate-binding protein YgfZ